MKKGIQQITNKPIITEIVFATCNSRDKFRALLDVAINRRAVENISIYEAMMTQSGITKAAIKTMIVYAFSAVTRNRRAQIKTPQSHVSAMIT